MIQDVFNNRTTILQLLKRILRILRCGDGAGDRHHHKRRHHHRRRK